MSELAAAWSELLDVLESRASVSREHIRLGTVDGPDVVERALGITLPAELREWFTLHDGTGNNWDAMFLPQAVPLGAREAAEDSRMIYDIWSKDLERDSRVGSPAGLPAYTWLAEYVMVGSDGCGGGFFVDTRPGAAQGCVRWWDKTESDDDYRDGPVAPSLAALVRAVSASLRDGDVVFQGRAWLPPLRATAGDGLLDWLDLREG